MSAQADRLEALLIKVSNQLDQVLASTLVGTEKQQPLDPEVWPDWYRDLYSLPNFKKELGESQQWLAEKIIGEQKANEIAAYIRGSWPGPKRTWKQPWAVFRNLAVREWGVQNGKSGSNLQPNPQEQEMADRARTERLNSRRGDLPNL